MSARFIVINADDFGLDPDLDDGIIATIERGLVRSVSMVGTGPGLDLAVQKLQGLRHKISIGAHLNLTDPPALSRVPPRGTFTGRHHSTVWTLLRQRNLTCVETEFRAQIERLLGAGVKLEKLDGHGHIHVLPRVFALTCRLAAEYRVPFVRTIRTFAPMQFTISAIKERAIQWIGAGSRHAVAECGLFTTDRVFGIANSGKMTMDAVQRALPHLQAASTEWIVHPGSPSAATRSKFPWSYDWEGERDLLMSARLQEILTTASIELVDFADLSLKPRSVERR